MHILDTDRLTIRQLTLDDAEFILRLLNEPSFIHFIGDRGVRSTEDARRYLVDGPLASYEKHGFGLFHVALRESGAPIGICGLLKRDSLDHPDVGFALFPEYWSQGYAAESASALIEWGRRTLHLHRIAAIVQSDNERSIRTLESLGLRFERKIQMRDEELDLFVTEP